MSLLFDALKIFAGCLVFIIVLSLAFDLFNKWRKL